MIVEKVTMVDESCRGLHFIPIVTVVETQYRLLPTENAVSITPSIYISRLEIKCPSCCVTDWNLKWI